MGNCRERFRVWMRNCARRVVESLNGLIGGASDADDRVSEMLELFLEKKDENGLVPRQ